MLNENLSAVATFIFQCRSNLVALSGPCPENAGLSRPGVGAHGTAALKSPVSEIHGLIFRGREQVPDCQLGICRDISGCADDHHVTDEGAVCVAHA